VLELRLIDPTSGAELGPAATSVDLNVMGLDGLYADGVASAGASGPIAVSGHVGSVPPGTAIFTRFTATPTPIQTTTPRPSVRDTAIAWAPGAQRFGYAVLDASGVGFLFVFDTGGSLSSQLSFTGASDSPKGDTLYTLAAVAASEARFVVAWTDDRSGRTEIYATSLDASTGQAATPAAVLVSTPSSAEKLVPRVVYDGRSVVVSWLEETGAGAYQLMLRRYDEMLRPIAGTLCATCGAASALPVRLFGLAARGPNDYGAAVSVTGDVHRLARVACNGP
jgi:hypothetical protein